MPIGRIMKRNPAAKNAGKTGTHPPGAPGDTEGNVYEDLDAVDKVKGTSGQGRDKGQGQGQGWGDNRKWDGEYECLSAVDDCDKDDYERLDSRERSGEGWTDTKTKGRALLDTLICWGEDGPVLNIRGIFVCGVLVVFVLLLLAGWCLFVMEKISNRGGDICIYGPYGALNGTPFSDENISNTSRITAVKLWKYTNFLCAVMFKYGDTWGPRRGAPLFRGEVSVVYNMAPGENVTSVRGNFGPNSLFDSPTISYIQIITTHYYHAAVGRKPKQNQKFVTSGPRLLYISGLEGEGLVALRLHYSCCVDL